jgi:hypothetical protein
MPYTYISSLFHEVNEIISKTTTIKVFEDRFFILENNNFEECFLNLDELQSNIVYLNVNKEINKIVLSNVFIGRFNFIRPTIFNYLKLVSDNKALFLEFFSLNKTEFKKVIKTMSSYSIDKMSKIQNSDIFIYYFIEEIVKLQFEYYELDYKFYSKFKKEKNNNINDMLYFFFKCDYNSDEERRFNKMLISDVVEFVNEYARIFSIFKKGLIKKEHIEEIKEDILNYIELSGQDLNFEIVIVRTVLKLNNLLFEKNNVPF